MSDTARLIDAITALQIELERQQLRGQVKIVMPKEDIAAVTFRVERDFGAFLVADSSAKGTKLAGAEFVWVDECTQITPEGWSMTLQRLVGH